MQLVFVQNWPKPDLVSLHWAEAGVAVSFFAVLVALITLYLVSCQIRLAKDALKLAQDELDLTRDALKLTAEELELTTQGLGETRRSNEMVRESLEYAREQSESLGRRAKLEVFSDTPLAGLPVQSRANVELYVVNRGTRTASSAVLRVLMPPSIGYAPGYNPRSQGWRVFATAWNSGTLRYEVLERDIRQPMPPKCVVQIHVMEVQKTQDAEGTILCQIMFDDGVTPEDGSATALKFRGDMEMTDLIVGLPPR